MDSTSEENTPRLQQILQILYLFLKLFIATLEGVYRTIIPPPKISVEGEIILITGAGHGIGQELALQYAALDATVICLDIDAQRNTDTVNKIINKGKFAYGYKCDVTNRIEVMDTVKKIQNEIGDITILINNAGILHCHPLLEHTEHEIRKTVEVNITSHFWTIQAVLPSMLKKNHGSIVAISSSVALSGTPNMVPYSATKYAVRGLMDSLRNEIRKDTSNIQFTTVLPCIVDTGLITKFTLRLPISGVVISPKTAASCIISAQRRGLVEVTIPRLSLMIATYTRLFPTKVGNLITDFIGVHFESDLINKNTNN
ncbi:hypothetical protein FQA39_LY04899 [Lamprigera yunnana]|nr:hypothetical protein FQA39_LY04899 [Lamprigera yunnana]